MEKEKYRKRVEGDAVRETIEGFVTRLVVVVLLI